MLIYNVNSLLHLSYGGIGSAGPELVPISAPQECLSLLCNWHSSRP
jgi:hypothetical protein